MLGRIRTLFLLIAFVSTGCGNHDNAWEMAQRDDNPTAFLEFLGKYPDSEYADAARARMEALKEINAWERAKFRNSEAGYAAFMEKYPDSEFGDDVNKRIAGLERDARWAVVKDEDSIEIVAAFLREYPEAPQSEEARELLSALEAREAATASERPGDFRLQLAAFRTARAAENEVRRITALFSETLMGPVYIETPAEGAPSSLLILKSVPMNWSEAQAACETLKSYEQTCLIINR